jgi:hypothetical protein
MPAVYAPNGKRTAILERVAFHLTPTEGLIRIDSFAALHDDIRLRGSIDWPLGQTMARNDAAIIPPIENFYKLIAKSLTEKKRFSPFIEPTLEFALTAQESDLVDVSAHLSCQHLKYEHATGTDFSLKADFTIQNGEFTPMSPLLLQAEEITIPRFDFSANAITAHIAVEQWSDLLNGNWPNFEISAHRISTHRIELKSPQVKISPSNFPELKFSGSTSGLNGGVAFSGQLNSNNQSGEIHANGSVDLFTLFPKSALAKLPTLSFGSTPYYDLSVQLREGFQLEKTSFRINAHQITANDLTFDHILAEGSYHEDTLKLDKVLIDRDQQWINATFQLNYTSNEFKLALFGAALPNQYGSILPTWWDNIFKDIKFDSKSMSYGDFMIHGRSTPQRDTFFFGHASATNLAYKKAHIDKAELIVRGRGNYVELDNITAQSGKGWAKGSIGFTSAPFPSNGLRSVRYEFDSLMPLQIASKIFGGQVAKIISDFEVPQLPKVKLKGVMFNDSDARYGNEDALHLEADIRSPITFHNTPFDYLHFKLYNHQKNIFLRDVEFGYADGTGTATIDILGDQHIKHLLRFQLSLKNANQAKAIDQIPSFNDSKSDLTPKRDDADKQAKSTGTLDLNLHAEGPLDNMYQFDGYGDFKIINNQLGSIQLLGPLSSLLQNTRLNFTSFNLNQMAAAFKIDQTLLHINELTIDGPRTQIWAEGTLKIPDQALDMKVSVSLFANMGNPNSAISTFRKLITSPLPNLLIFHLTGTLHDQKIRSQFDPRNFIPGLKNN